MAFTAKKTAPKAAKAKAEKAEKVKGPKIGEIAKAAILEGKNNEEVIAAVTDEIPDSEISNASVNWYRSNLRKAGKKVPSSRQPKPAKPALVKATGKKTPLASKTNIKPSPSGRKPQSKVAPKASEGDDMGLDD
jgi:predicted extracellular nuclease